MFIRKIHIQNYRIFNDFTIEFQNGLNVIVGSNNSGKTSLLHAINLLNNPNKICFDDFNKNNLLKYKELYMENPPLINIEYSISHTIVEDDVDDESIIKLLPFLGIKNLSSNRRIENDKVFYDIEAKIQSQYILDAKHINEYQNDIKNAQNYNDFARIFQSYVEHYYSWVYTNGISTTKIDQKMALSIFNIRFIEAERTSTEIHKETRKEIDNFSKDEKNFLMISEFREDITKSLNNILATSINKFANLFTNENNEIGLEKGHVSITPSIKPNISITDSYSTDVKDTESGYIIPLQYNGLGYNNLINIYMMIKLNEIQTGKEFRILSIEEPEAHLHPAMQYKLFKYLRELDKKNELKQQLFVTTHSSNISAVAGLDNMYMMAYDRNNNRNDCVQQSLHNLFDEKDEYKMMAKRHLTKFLDVTKSDMLFADKVILVEGLAEKLLLPLFLEKCGFSYENEHISIIEIGGKHFEYFVELFNNNAVYKKVLCITDKDIDILYNTDDIKNFKAYKDYAPTHINKLKTRFNIENFNIVTQKIGGKTFETELLLTNIHNSKFIQLVFQFANTQLFNLYNKYGNNIILWNNNKSMIDKRSLSLFEKYFNLYNNFSKKNNAFYNNICIADLFLHCIEKSKGDFALYILSEPEMYLNEENIVKVPQYIKEGLEWLLK